MSHTELFQDIRVWGLVTEFLTKHNGIWVKDKHYWQCHKETCPCCCARKAMRHSGSCELCTTAWQLSSVSRSMLESVVAYGRSLPNWVRPRLKKRPKRQSAYKAQHRLDSSTNKALGKGCMSHIDIQTFAYKWVPLEYDAPPDAFTAAPPRLMAPYTFVAGPPGLEPPDTCVAAPPGLDVSTESLCTLGAPQPAPCDASDLYIMD